jgi:hypothetical protein
VPKQKIADAEKEKEIEALAANPKELVASPWITRRCEGDDPLCTQHVYPAGTGFGD